MQTKIKSLNNSNHTLNYKNEINNNNSSIKTKANSSLYTNSKDDYDNRYKSEELYTLYKDNPKNESNIFSYKTKTMSNVKSSRNNNFFTLLHKQSNKNKNNISIQNNMMKNYGSNSLKKNNSSHSSGKRNFINTTRKKKNLKQNVQNNNSMNITNNTYNMSKNNIMINLNPRNMNVNMEKLKVQKKLFEYQKLIDQKLNELLKNRHSQVKRNGKYKFHIRRNSSPNIYINNTSQRKKKSNNSIMGLEYFLRKAKKKSITPNTITQNDQESRSVITKKIISNSTIDSIKRTKKNNRNNSRSISMKKKIMSVNFNNMKNNLNKSNFNSKTKDLSTSQQDINNYDSIISNRKEKLSLRKYIFSKCSNPVVVNEIKN